MKSVLSKQLLTAVDTQIATLSAGQYALPVRFVVLDQYVECLIPTWCGIGDLLAELDAVLMVVTEEASGQLRWVFVRGRATIVPDPVWDRFKLSHTGKVELSDLYQVIRIEPKRIELVDEERGWGYRETADW